MQTLEMLELDLMASARRSTFTMDMPFVSKATSLMLTFSSNESMMTPQALFERRSDDVT